MCDEKRKRSKGRLEEGAGHDDAVAGGDLEPEVLKVTGICSRWDADTNRSNGAGQQPKPTNQRRSLARNFFNACAVRELRVPAPDQDSLFIAMQEKLVIDRDSTTRSS
jgi:hypothetical protein